MAKSLQDRMRESLATGLRRKTMTRCSKWSEEYIVMAKPFPGPLRFRYFPWAREMHDYEGPRMVGQKAAQMGYTVTLMNRTFYTIDYRRESVLYLLPSKTPDAADFSTTKFDPALEQSPYLDNMFSDVKNQGTKRAGSAILYIRGSNSRKGLKSISVSEVICDEFDEMPEHTIPLAQERMSGQPRKVLILASTPRFPGLGINKQFLESTQDHFFFPCPACSRQIELKHENLVVTATDIYDERIKQSFIKCVECDAALTNPEDNEEQFAERKAAMLEKAVWVPTGEKRNFDIRGFYINQLYSPTVYPWILATEYLRSLTNKASEQEYHNSKMGDAHEVEGARISDSNIDDCRKNYSSGMTLPNKLVTMGVDVGKWLHYEICAWDIPKYGSDINTMSKPILLQAGKVAHFTELDGLMRQFHIYMAVVDWQPETRLALEFAKRFSGHVRLCRYGKGGEKTSIIQDDSDKFYITADRTAWLDMSLGRFHNKSIDLPSDISLEYKSHLKNIARIYEQDKDGNPVGRYVNNGDDHFAHARNYCEIALPLAAAFHNNANITSVL